MQTVGLQAYLNEQFAKPATLEHDISYASANSCVRPTLFHASRLSGGRSLITAPDQLRQRVAFALSEMFVVSTNSVNARAVTYLPEHAGQRCIRQLLYHDAGCNAVAGHGCISEHAEQRKARRYQRRHADRQRELSRARRCSSSPLAWTNLNQDGTLQLDANGNPIPIYTETQVQAFARAYTGWTYATATGGTPTNFPNNTPNYDSPMAPVESQHDQTAKTLLNGTTLPAGQTAEPDLTGALTNIFDHPNVGPFVCRQLIQHLVTSNPSPAYVSRVAAVFANDGTGVRGNLQGCRPGDSAGHGSACWRYQSQFRRRTSA